MIHDRTLIRVPKSIRKETNKLLKSTDVEMVTKFDLLKSMVNKATNNTQNKVSLKFRIGGNWMSTKVESIDQAIADLKGKLGNHEINYQTMGSVTAMMITKYEERKNLNKKAMVRGGRLILSMNAQYLVISPQSETNCF